MDLHRVLDAESVAVVGASNTVTKRGYQAIRTLLEEKYEGKIYPVNPRERTILGLKCYPRVKAIPERVDIVLVATPARTVAAILEDCATREVAGAVVLAAGFGELGLEGKALEDQMVRTARHHGIRIIGPNTSGMLNCKRNLNLVGIRNVARGDIALLTQSGNMALTLITEASIKSRKGFTYYVGVGNEADIKFHEYLEFFGEDPDTKAILMYVEGLRQGRQFLQQAHKTSRSKPIILFKGGRSATGKQSAGSHTGALAGISAVAKTEFQRAGIIVIENPDELFPAAETLSSLPPISNNSVAILADGGGHATIAADLLTDLGLKIPALGKRTQQRLKRILPAAATVTNPVDVAGGTDDNPAVFAECARVLLDDTNVGGLLVVGLFGGYGIRFDESLAFIEEDAAHQMGKMLNTSGKPIVLHSLFSSAKPHALDLLRYYNIPVYDALNVACKCIGVLAEYGGYLASYRDKSNFVLEAGKNAKTTALELIRNARSEGRQLLMEHECRQVLKLHRLPVAQDRLVQTAEEAARAARAFQGPVALKIASPDIVHKSEAGGVKLNLKTLREVRRAFGEITANACNYNPHADIRGVLVTPMAPSGVEVIVGTRVDDQFGPVIMFGLGGVWVEILRDVVFRVLPLTPRAAKTMIAEIKSASILKGIRGNPPADLKALQKLLLQCSKIVQAYPAIEEMDLNPVIVHEKGLSIVDARIILKTVRP